MPKDGYTSVTIPDDDFEDAKAIKDELGISWGDYISPHRWHSVFDEANRHDDAKIPEGVLEVVESTPEELDEIKRMVREATEAAQSAEQSVEQLTEGRR